MGDVSLSIDSISRVLKPVFDSFDVTKAVLFGSYARGSATVKSDVDIVVDTDLRCFALMGLYCAVQDALGGIDLDLFTRYELIPGVGRISI